MHKVRRIASGCGVSVGTACSKAITAVLSKVNVIRRAEGIANCVACSIIMHVTSSLATDLHAGIENAVTVSTFSSIGVEGVAIRAANLSIDEKEDVSIAEIAACGVVDEEVSWAANGKS